MFGQNFGALGYVSGDFIPVVVPANDYNLETETRATIETETGKPLRTETP
jgi:hypothetical protein